MGMIWITEMHKVKNVRAFLSRTMTLFKTDQGCDSGEEGASLTLYISMIKTAHHSYFEWLNFMFWKPITDPQCNVSSPVTLLA